VGGIKNNEQHFFLLLNIVDHVFKQHDIEYWLDFGSLIGAVREDTYIEWDKDMDISVHFRDVKRIYNLKSEFRDHGVCLSGFVKFDLLFKGASMCVFPLHTVKKNNCLYLVNFRYPVCFWLNKIFGRGVVSLLKKSMVYLWLCSKIALLDSVQSRFVFLGNFAYVEFCRTVCPIPEYPDEYLSFRFGDWRTPHRFNKHSDVNNMYHKRWKDGIK